MILPTDPGLRRRKLIEIARQCAADRDECRARYRPARAWYGPERPHPRTTIRRALGYAALCMLGAAACLGRLSTRRVGRLLSWMERRLKV